MGSVISASCMREGGQGLKQTNSMMYLSLGKVYFIQVKSSYGQSLDHLPLGEIYSY